MEKDNSPMTTDLGNKRESSEPTADRSLLKKKPKLAENEDSVDDFAEQLLEGMWKLRYIISWSGRVFVASRKQLIGWKFKHLWICRQLSQNVARCKILEKDIDLGSGTPSRLCHVMFYFDILTWLLQYSLIILQMQTFQRFVVKLFLGVGNQNNNLLLLQYTTHDYLENIFLWFFWLYFVIF